MPTNSLRFATGLLAVLASAFMSAIGVGRFRCMAQLLAAVIPASEEFAADLTA
jgi:hypothetical protein